MSASPHAEKKNAWWISTIELVEKYETANSFLRQGDEEVNKRIKQQQKNVFT